MSFETFFHDVLEAEVSRLLFHVSHLLVIRSDTSQSRSFQQRYVCFIDPSSNPYVPGWPLRNLLTLLLLRFKVKNINVIAWKDELGGSNVGKSRTRLARVKLGAEKEGEDAKNVILEGKFGVSNTFPRSITES